MIVEIAEDDKYSRSRLAGYNPEILSASHVLVVGAGAVGQNLALNLALSGIGTITIVDFDLFEKHNATRSPFYPSNTEKKRWHLEKARTVAHKLRSLMTASQPKVFYAVTPVQALGDLPLLQSHLVFAAVDNQLTRAYLAERCHMTGRALIEGGMFAQRLNVSLFGPSMRDSCYRCFSPEKEGAYSCTRFALNVETQGVVPALQNTASILASLAAEMGIQWLHQNLSPSTRRFYLDIHEMSLSSILLPVSPACPGVHWPEKLAPLEVLEISGSSSLIDLQLALQKKYGLVQIRFPEEIVIHNFCLKCERLVKACVATWRWLSTPFCQECAGPFPLAAPDDFPSSRISIYTDEYEEAIMQIPCAQLGLPSGTLCEFWPITHHDQLGARCLVQLKGNIHDFVKMVI